MKNLRSLYVKNVKLKITIKNQIKEKLLMYIVVVQEVPVCHSYNRNGLTLI